MFNAKTLLLGSLFLYGSLLNVGSSSYAATYSEYFLKTCKDPISVDPNYKAKDAVVHIPTNGVKINGLMMLAAGKERHPTIILFHGVPGNEKNLDLAQAIRRAGWNVLTFNYRGSWGSPGNYSFVGNLKDAEAVLSFIRNPQIQKQFNINEKQIVLAGHSMGGWVVAMTAAQEQKKKSKDIIGAIMFSAANMGGNAIIHPNRDQTIQWMAEDNETLAGTNPEKMADEVIKNQKAFDMDQHASELKKLPLLMIYSDDPFAAGDIEFAQKVKAAGNNHSTLIHIPTDHSYADHRIALSETIINWLNQLSSQAPK